MSIDPTPQVNSQYGAPMGRPAFGKYGGLIPSTPFQLVRVPLNQGGYDRGGAYWGTGQPLYWYCAYAPETVTYGQCQNCGCGARYAINGEKCEHVFPTREDETEVSDYIRADSREHAKEIVSAKYPGAKFKR